MGQTPPIEAPAKEPIPAALRRCADWLTRLSIERRDDLTMDELYGLSVCIVELRVAAESAE